MPDQPPPGETLPIAGHELPDLTKVQPVSPATQEWLQQVAAAFGNIEVLKLTLALHGNEIAQWFAQAQAILNK